MFKLLLAAVVAVPAVCVGPDLFDLTPNPEWLAQEECSLPPGMEVQCALERHLKERLREDAKTSS